MRAVTGDVVSSKPCSLAKAIRVLARFADSAASHLPSSDAATYLRTTAEAANDLYIFRRDLRRSHHQQQQQSGDVEAPREGGESEKRHRRERERDRECKAEENGVIVLDGAVQGTSGEKKSKNKKRKEIEDHVVAVPHGGLHSPVSEKRKKKEKQHLKEEDQTWDVEENEKKEKIGKKKHLKQEEKTEVAMIHVGVASEKKRKKMNHVEEKEIKKEVVSDDDLGSDKKRKNKRSRMDAIDSGYNEELVEHTNKKQRK